MAFFRRFTTLLRADAHGALDALEDRPLLLRQYLREAEEALAAKKARRDALEAEQRDLERTAARLEPQMQDLDRDVDLALEEDRSDLARFAVEKLLPLRRQSEGIAARQRDLGQEKEELAELLERQESQLEDLKLRVHAALEQAQAEEGPGSWDPGYRPVREEDVELELLRRASSASQVDDRAGAATGGAGGETHAGTGAAP